jgi:hypothetical protein
MPPKSARLPLEKVVDGVREALESDSLWRSLTVASTFVHLACHCLNGQQERTNAFIVAQRFPKDRPAGEIEYRPTDAGTMKVSA